MDELDKNCILFFVKYPEKGQVKTRLSAELGEAVAVELYRGFILDLLSMLEELGIYFQICFCPANSQEKFAEWLGKQYSYISQQGEDLGQRMKNGFIQTFAQGYHRIIIIGSDSPDLPGELIHAAFRSLKTHDAVIGPCFDGGYYLIGFNSNTFLPETFEGIEWSIDTVFRKTLSILEEAELRTYRLPEWRDVDTFADLKDLVQRNRDREFRSSETISYILESERLRRRLSSP